ncbi:alpha/beta fold hydrolase [Enterococcus sp. DIV0187]|uniref:alpha/beta fold hydrolase n=1 Tax=Enterococcus sp. DIV0187 TaxID=2774644 RepID=UPI003F250A76
MKRMILKVLLVLLILLAVFVLGLLGYREVKKHSVRSTNTEIVNKGGISEHREVKINGMKQHIAIEGQKKDTPVVLFLHGGPGMPIPFGVSSRGAYTKATKDITAVYWDQRGAGKSYADAKASDLTIDQMVADTITLTNYLRKEFKQEKIYLMGVSWGTIPGLLAVSQEPQLYHSYFSYAQVVNPKKGERIVYDWLSGAIDDPDQEHLKFSEQDQKRLKELGAPPYNKKEDKEYSEIMNQTLGKKEMKTEMSAYLKPLLFSPDYSLVEIYATMIKGPELSMDNSKLADEVKEIDIPSMVKKVAIPIYFLSGRYDRVIPVSQVRDFMNDLDAPKKDLTIFEHSSHQPCLRDLTSVFNRVNSIIEDDQDDRKN